MRRKLETWLAFTMFFTFECTLLSCCWTCWRCFVSPAFDEAMAATATKWPLTAFPVALFISEAVDDYEGELCLEERAYMQKESERTD